MTRSDEWMDEFESLLATYDDDTRELIADGSIEICPQCLELSAYAYQDTTDDDDTGPVPGDVASIGTCSGMGEWQCGHCKAHLVASDSPLLAPCYTHSED